MGNKLNRIKLLACSIIMLALTAGGMLTACTVPRKMAQEVITLSYGQFEAATHISARADMAWIDRVERDSRGQLAIDSCWEGALISRDESCTQVVQGVVDIAHIDTCHARSGYEIDRSITGYYYGIPSYDQRRSVFEAVWDRFPVYADEFKDMKILASTVNPTYQMVSIKPVSGVNDFRGMRIGTDSTYASLIRELGGEYINLPLSEAHNALQEGSLDACLAPFPAIAANKLYEVARYITILDLNGSCHPTRAMNLESWKRLPSSMQEILDYRRRYWEQEDDRQRDTQEIQSFEIARRAGAEVMILSQAELYRFYAVAYRAMRVEAGMLDRKGLPGIQMLDTIRYIVESEQRFPISKPWQIKPLMRQR